MKIIKAIVKAKIQAGFFILLFFIVSIGLGVIAFILNTLDISYNENDLVRQYQYSKLEAFDGKLDTIIVGGGISGLACAKQ